jgi:hypothetical protein
MVSIYDLKVECEECGATAEPDPPENRLKWVAGLALLFALIGGAFGTAVGVATAGVGFAAWIFLLPAGLYIGYVAGNSISERLDGPSCPECGSEHTGSGTLPF